MDTNVIAVMFYMVFTVILVVYIWRYCGVENRLSDIESWIELREKDLRAIHNAIKQLNENQKLFVKPGESVIIYRQEEKFEQGQGDA